MIGELIDASVLDKRVYDASGPTGDPGIYIFDLPGRAMPFVIYRSWKIPTGYVNEEIRFTGPSGRLVWRWGPEPRRMEGSMDQTYELDLIDDAILDEHGMYLVAFIVNDEVLAEVEVPVYITAAPAKLPKEIEEGLKKSDIIWVGTGDEPGTKKVPEYASGQAAPVWFAYKNGKILLLSQKEAGPEEQTVPGVPGSDSLLVTTRRKGRDTSADRFWASVRMIEDGAEFESAAATLVDRRRSRVGAPAESLSTWRSTCVIAELTPLVEA